MRKKIIIASLILLALGSLAFAQAKVQLTVQCDQTGAKVYLNDNLAGYTSPYLSLSIFPGNYTIRVVKDGFSEYRTNFTAFQSPITIVAHLGGSPQTPPAPPFPPATPVAPITPVVPTPPAAPPTPIYQLTIDANIDGARVYLNGSYAGITPFSASLPKGSYSIVVRLDGYEDYSRTVRLSSAYHFRATLTPLQYPVYINAVNVSDASIYRDYTYVGTAPYRGTWSLGSYLVRISAPGYAEYSERIYVNGPVNLQVSLSSLAVDFEIKLPESFSSSWKKLGKFNEVEVYLDGMRLDSLRGKAMPGTHRITLVYRDLRLEGDFQLLPGKPATIEFSLGVNVY
ncbi:MAG: PEGA domain-containing protein [Spirochaetaceae bacterium]|nr:PEGA domain-containing protein [Spirochaetaceae bacterium]